MKYQPPSSSSSQPHWLPHSTEVEHRLTVVENDHAHQGDWNEATDQQLEAHDRRLNLHEKAILAIGAVLQILMQDKYPTLAALIKAALP